ncbi:MAG: hypothetical protein DWQ04_15530 [Chloroflexi bacterium]|nr:MAG: hypothetical protein DWQ04_15530 [Chloroflexota bacterium]
MTCENKLIFKLMVEGRKRPFSIPHFGVAKNTNLNRKQVGFQAHDRGEETAVFHSHFGIAKNANLKP